jgi:hypothetical protein
LEAVEIETRAVSRIGGEALVEGFGGFRIDALAEEDPLLGVEASRGRWGSLAGGGMPSLFEVAHAAVEELVVAAEPGLEVAQPEGVDGGEEGLAPQAADLRLHPIPQLFRRNGQGAAEEALEVDAELLDVAAEPVEGLAESRCLAPRGGRRRGRRAGTLEPGLHRLERRGLGTQRAGTGSRGSLGVHGSPRMLGA